ncbi:MAG TPA: hypothetical protein VIX37_15370 [Candidatus Sulfotelmatobacter sp.]
MRRSTTFARKVSVRLKPDSLVKFTSLMDREILPWLRRHKGFLDLITLAVPDGCEIATISFWDHEDNAQCFNASGYPRVLEFSKNSGRDSLREDLRGRQLNDSHPRP